MRKLIITTGAVVALAIAGAAPVAAEHGGPVGVCPEGYTLEHGTKKEAGSEELRRFVFIDQNDDGYVCRSDTELLDGPERLIDNSRPRFAREV